MQQRNGETIDEGLVKTVVGSLVSLGLDRNDLNKVCFDVYEEHFETPFIAETVRYYKNESATFLAENSVSDYLKKAEDRLREEEDRVQRCLCTNTRQVLIDKCVHVLVREHAALMWGSFQSLLDYDKEEDLHRMFTLLSRIPEGLEPLRTRFEAHVKRVGLAAVSKLIVEDGSTDSLDPEAYVGVLLETHRKNSEIVNRSFEGEAGFAASLDTACREFINRNAATRTSSAMSSGFIAKYLDMLLRKNSKLAKEDGLDDRVVRKLFPGWDCFLSIILGDALKVS